jgi:hypothetical protein
MAIDINSPLIEIRKDVQAYDRKGVHVKMQMIEGRPFTRAELTQLENLTLLLR